MDKRFSTGWVLAFSVLVAYLLLASLLTERVALPAGVLFVVIIVWFSVYKFLHKNLGNQELITRMYFDLKGMLEGIKEKIAQEETRRRAAAEQEEQTRAERERRRAEGERRRASRPTRDPATSKYAELIESRVREGGQTRRPEGQ